MTVWPRCQEQMVLLVGNIERSDHSWLRVAETPGSLLCRQVRRGGCLLWSRHGCGPGSLDFDTNAPFFARGSVRCRVYVGPASLPIPRPPGSRAAPYQEPGPIPVTWLVCPGTVMSLYIKHARVEEACTYTSCSPGQQGVLPNPPGLCSCGFAMWP